MGGQLERPSVTKDDRWTQLRVRINLAIDTVTNAKVLRCHCHCHILTLLESADACSCGHEDDTVDTFADLDAINVRTNVEVGVFAADDPDVAPRSHIRHISHCHTLVQEGDILRLVRVLGL